MLGRVVAAAVAALALAGGASAGDLTPAEVTLLQEMNRVRTANGASPLRPDARLQAAARAHSADMLRSGAFSHGDFLDRMHRFGIRTGFVGENLAWGTGASGSAAAIVAAWLASPGHRSNLLRRGFRRVGVGLRTGTFAGVAGAAVVTADFGGR